MPGTTKPLAEVDHDMLVEIDRKLDAIVQVTEDLSRQLESLHDLREDLVPIAHEGLMIAYRKLHELEQEGVIDFLRETSAVLKTISTSFAREDVKALGENVVHILETIRGLTQPEILDMADRTAGALQNAPQETPGRIGVLRSLNDPEVRRGLGMLLEVLRQLGGDPPATQPNETRET